MTMSVTIAMVTSIAMSVIIMSATMFTMLPILWNVNIVIPSVPYEVDRAATRIISAAIA